MHKFLRAAGFSMYTKKKDIEKLLDLLERQPSMTRCVQVDEGVLLPVSGEPYNRIHGRVFRSETYGERDLLRHGG